MRGEVTAQVRVWRAVLAALEEMVWGLVCLGEDIGGWGKMESVIGMVTWKLKMKVLEK
jgi:hypothetical protein